MQNLQQLQKPSDKQLNFYSWLTACGKTLCYAIAIAAFIIIPLNGAAFVLGAGIL